MASFSPLKATRDAVLTQSEMAKQTAEGVTTMADAELYLFMRVAWPTAMGQRS